MWWWWCGVISEAALPTLTLHCGVTDWGAVSRGRPLSVLGSRELQQEGGGSWLELGGCDWARSPAYCHRPRLHTHTHT